MSNYVALLKSRLNGFISIIAVAILLASSMQYLKAEHTIKPSATRSVSIEREASFAGNGAIGRTAQRIEIDPDGLRHKLSWGAVPTRLTA